MRPANVNRHSPLICSKRPVNNPSHGFSVEQEVDDVDEPPNRMGDAESVTCTSSVISINEVDEETPLKTDPPDEPEQAIGPSVSYVNPKLQARRSPTGSGMFALQDVKKDEVLVIWTGRIVSAEEALHVMNTEDKHYLLQIGDGFYQCPLSKTREPADFTNHSCEPNAGFGKNSPICLSAMRDIKLGEEILFDYAMCETDDRLWEAMECECGKPACRKLITAHNWREYRELWVRYNGYWSPHVREKIEAIQAAEAKLSDPESRLADIDRPYLGCLRRIVKLMPQLSLSPFHFPLKAIQGISFFGFKPF